MTYRDLLDGTFLVRMPSGGWSYVEWRGLVREAWAAKTRASKTGAAS